VPRNPELLGWQADRMRRNAQEEAEQVLRDAQASATLCLGRGVNTDTVRVNVVWWFHRKQRTNQVLQRVCVR
jgi:hypothetical protein